MHFPRAYPSILSFYPATGLVAATLLMLAHCGTAQGGTIWDGGGGATTNINTAANWDGDALPTSLTDGTQTLTFGTGGSTATINTDVNALGLVINRDAPFTIANGAGNLTIGTGGITVTLPNTTARTHTISESNLILAGNQTWSVTNNSGAAVLIVSSAISGANFGITKNGSGQLTLTGTNTFTGGIVINAGRVDSNSGSLGTGNVTIASGAFMGLTSTGTYSNNFTIAGAGTGSGAIQVPFSTGNFTISGLTTLTGDATVGSRGQASASGSNLIFAGGITTGGANRTLTLSVLATSTFINNAITISTNSVNLGTGGTLDIAAATNSEGTGTVNLNVGNNTWGTLIVKAASTPGASSNGTLKLGAANALGGSGAVLQLGSTTTALENITVNLNGNNQTIGGLRSFGSTGSASANGTRTVTSATAATLTIDNSSATNYLYDGVISGGISLVKNGSATQTLSGNNTYTGATTISAGTLILSGNGTLGTSTIILSGGTLDMGGKSLTNTFGSLTGGTLSNGTLTNNGSNYDLQSGTVSAALAGTNGVNKTTSGTVTLSGANNYTGTTTINQGVLTITSNSSLPGFTNNGRYSVADGATLGVSNAVTDADIASMLGTTNFAAGAAIGFDTTSGSRTYSSNLINTSQGALGSTKLGSNTLTLTGNNTYTGTTTISAGTLSISGSSTSTLSGRITGAGAFTQSTGSSAGSLTINNDTNDFTGQFRAEGAFSSKVFFTSIADFGTASALGRGTAGTAINLSNGYMVYTGTASSSSNRTWSGVNSNTIENNSATGVLTLSGNYAQSIANGTFTLRGSNTGANTFAGNISAAASGAGSLLSLTKDGAGTWVLTGNNSYTGATTINAGILVFQNKATRTGGSAVTAAAAGTIGLGVGGGGFTDYSDADVANLFNSTLSGFTLNVASGVAIDTTAGNFTQSTALTAARALTKLGSNTLTLTGNNTYSGATTISAGTLLLSGSGTLGTSTISISGGTLDMGGKSLTNTLGSLTAGTLSNGTLTNNGGNYALQNGTVSAILAGTNGVNKTTSATLTLSGNNTYSGTTTITAGTLQLGHANALGATTSGLVVNGTLDLNGNSITKSTLSGSTGSITSVSAATLTFNSTNAAIGTYNGVIGGNVALSITNSNTSGQNTVLTLGGSNTYTGNTTIYNSALAITNSAAFGNSTVIVQKGGQTNLDFGGQIRLSGGITVSNNMTLAGQGYGGFGGALQNTSGSNTYTGTITISDTTTRIQSAAGSLSLNGTINLGSGSYSSLFQHVGDIRLGGNGITGSATGFTVFGGGSNYLIADRANAWASTTALSLGSSGSTNYGRLDLNGFDQTVGSLSAAGTDASQNIITNRSSTLATLTVNSSSGFAGTLSGNLALMKAGSGTLILTSNNTYTGATTVAGGTLLLSGNGTLSTSAISISGGTLDMGGKSLTNTFGSLTAGTLSNGTLTNNGANYDLQNGTVSAVLAGTNGVNKTGSGTVTLSGSNTYNGTTTVSSGTLLLSGNGTLGASTVSISGGTLGMGGKSLTNTFGSLTGGTLSNGTLTNNGGNYDLQSGTVSAILAGTNGVNKTTSGTVTLSVANTYNGTTTVSSGTLTAAAGNALANTSQVVLNNGGSFLVTAENAVNDNAAINLNGGRMAMSGNFNETVGALTLSANSTLDFSGFVGTLRFSGVTSWAAGANLAIWNWSGEPRYGPPVNNYLTPSNLVFTNNSTLSSNLANISFYSDSGITSIGSGFERGFSGGGTEIIAVPETETYLYAAALLAGIVVQYLRRRARRKPLGGSAFALLDPCSERREQGK
jgi:autotransporter-associated beta strand protein